jgi:signal transduction histidine kinase
MKPKWKLGILITILSLLIGFLDSVTGFEFGFFIFYFLPVSFAAWFLGRSGWFVFAILCAILWLFSLLYTGHIYSNDFFYAWNTLVRFVSFAVIGFSISKIKFILDSEKEISKKLNESIAERDKSKEALRALNATLELKVAERTQVAETKSNQLRNLAMELINVEEEERRRISELLHDDLQQLLSATLLHLDAAGNLEAEPEIDSVRQLIRESISKVRSLSRELSPAVLYHSGLVTGLNWLASQMKEKFGLKVEVRVELDREIDCSSTQVFIYRAVQELLFNIVKHANIKTACVTLKNSDKDFGITVEDQGQGFDTKNLTNGTAGLGLMSIRERANYFRGTFEIYSSPGKGSRFTISLPISPVHAPQFPT